MQFSDEILPSLAGSSSLLPRRSTLLRPGFRSSFFLDVFMAECDTSSCGSCSSVIEPGWVDAAECSSIPLDLQAHFVEEIGFNVVAGEGRAVLVDGYDSAEGTYTIEVDCTCS